MQHHEEKANDCKSCPMTMNADIAAFIPDWICDKDGSPCSNMLGKVPSSQQVLVDMPVHAK